MYNLAETLAKAVWSIIAFVRANAKTFKVQVATSGTPFNDNSVCKRKIYIIIKNDRKNCGNNCWVAVEILEGFVNTNLYKIMHLGKN